MFKEAVGYVVVGAISLAAIIGGMFLFGKASNKFEATIGTEYKNIKREQFENSTSYVHGMIKDLSKCKKEYDLAKDESEKKAILSYIDSTFAQFDISKIDNDDLRMFLQDVRDGNL